VFRRKLAKTADYSPAYTEQKELLRRAEEGLRDAEMRALMVKRWKPALQQAVLEFHASTRRIKDFAAGEVPRAAALLERLVAPREGFFVVAPPTGREAAPASEATAGPDGSFDSIAASMLAAEPEPEPPTPPEPGTEGPAPDAPPPEAPPAPPDAGPAE